MPSDFNSFIPRTFDAVVDAAGNGDYTTLQAADDALVDGYTLFVKQGTYAAGVTVATHNAKIFCEAGTVIQAAITLSGDNVTLELGSGSDVQALIILSGDSCQLLCRNGVDLDGISATGDNCLIDGGGLDTVSNGGITRYAINIAGADCIIQNISAQTTAGGGTTWSAVQASSTALRALFSNVRIVGSDYKGFDCNGSDQGVIGCTVLGADHSGIDLWRRGKGIGNYVTTTGGGGIATPDGLADDSIIVGNVVDNITGNYIDIHANSENCVVVGNRTDGAIVDASGTSTVADNDITAF